MKLLRITLLLLIFSTRWHVLEGQGISHIPGQVLISLENDSTPLPVLQRFAREGYQPGLSILGKVSELQHVWLLQTAETEDAEQLVLNWLRRQPEVRMAQFNHLLENRSCPPNLTPDDPLFSEQWQHRNTGAGGGTAGADFNSESAWEITTGGLTPSGDTIVVAVIDGGIDKVHEDLSANLWKNIHETPGDSIDNDGNGFIDDYQGWNVYTQTDKITGTGTSHGTPVSAIIAAKGNNAKGVTGINWDVKLLFVSGNQMESAILAAYDYVHTARKRYNDSNGQQGAFVVSVNCSWGINFGQPEDYPLWCAAFDSLGAAGILSVAATANTPVDVDAFGDMPTACPSNYLVSVTSLTKTDQKATNAAWGAQSIDLGAYGKDVFTAGANNTYNIFSGTSFAAPQVCGAIGLIYSAPCFNLVDMAKANPAVAALWVKNILLSSAKPNADLQNKTVTGGRLDLYHFLQSYEDQCVACLSPFGISVSDIGTQQITVRWSSAASAQNTGLRYRKSGDAVWTLAPAGQSPFLLAGLTPCTDYELSLRSDCGGGSLSNWTPALAFRTDGCCAPPTNIVLQNITEHSATVLWEKVTAATGYRIRLQINGGPPSDIVVDTNWVSLAGLSLCTEYEVRVQTICGSEAPPFSDPVTLLTTGCGVCTDLSYCPAKGNSAIDEWISSVAIGSWNYVSGGGTGYENNTGPGFSLLTLYPQSALPVTLTPGFSGLAYKEYFRVYIDYNANGLFEEPDELAFDPGFGSDAPVNGEIYTPLFFTATGLTRMRVLMKYKGVQDTPPVPCESFEFGQVEDYCVQLGELVNGQNQYNDQQNELRVYPQPVTGLFFLDLPTVPEAPFDLTIFDAGGQPVLTRQIDGLISPCSFDASDWPSGVYFIRLENRMHTYQQKVLKIR